MKKSFGFSTVLLICGHVFAAGAALPASILTKTPSKIIGAEFEEAKMPIEGADPHFAGATFPGNPLKASLVIDLGSDEIMRLTCSEKLPATLKWSLETQPNLKPVDSGTKVYDQDLGCKNELRDIYYNISLAERSNIRGEVPVKFVINPGENLQVVYSPGAVAAPANIEDYFYQFAAAPPANEQFKTRIGSGNGEPSIRVCNAKRTSASYVRIGGNNKYELNFLSGSKSYWLSTYYSIGLSCNDNLPILVKLDPDHPNADVKWYSFDSKQTCQNAIDFILAKVKNGDCVDIVLTEAVPNPYVESLR